MLYHAGAFGKLGLGLPGSPSVKPHHVPAVLSSTTACTAPTAIAISN